LSPRVSTHKAPADSLPGHGLVFTRWRLIPQAVVAIRNREFPLIRHSE
jgi:hypothetical protein